MNTTINILLAIIATTLTASAEPNQVIETIITEQHAPAEPNLRIETIITEQHAPAEPQIISRPTVLTTSGQEAIIQTGTLEYAVTATLLDNGSIDVRAVLTDKQKDEKLATTRIEMQPGKVAQLQVGQFAFHTKTSLGAAAPPEQARELLQLRGEVDRLRSLETWAAQLRRDQMQAAQTKLTNAEVELVRLTKLHSERLVGDAELSRAKFAVELLKAEASGDAVAAHQIQLRQAEDELVRLTKLHSERLVGDAELSRAKFAVELLKTEASGDAVAAHQIQLRQAEDELARATELLSQSLIPEAVYDEAVRKVELLRAGGR